MEEGDSYGIVLALIALTIITEMWAGASAIARVAAVQVADRRREHQDVAGRLEIPEDDLPHRGVPPCLATASQRVRR